MDRVAVVIIENEDLGVAGARWDDKVSGLVGEDFSGGGVIDVRGKAVVHFVVVCVFCWPEVFLYVLLVGCVTVGGVQW